MTKLSFITDGDIIAEFSHTSEGDRFAIYHRTFGLRREVPSAEQREAKHRFVAELLAHMVDGFDEQMARELAPAQVRSLETLRALDAEGLRQQLTDSHPQTVLAVLYEYERRGLACPLDQAYANGPAMRDANVREHVSRLAETLGSS